MSRDFKLFLFSLFYLLVTLFGLFVVVGSFVEPWSFGFRLTLCAILVTLIAAPHIPKLMTGSDRQLPRIPPTLGHFDSSEPVEFSADTTPAFDQTYVAVPLRQSTQLFTAQERDDNRSIKRCPFCAEEIFAAAIKCKHCQSNVSTPIIAASHAEVGTKVDINFRRGATQVQRAAFNADMAKYVGGEIMILAALIGFMAKSLAAGLGTFFALSVLFNIPAVRNLLAIAFSIAWGVAAYFVVNGITNESSAPVIAAVIAFIFGLGAHKAFFQWQEDFK